jgi:hypothetical protein
MAKLRRFAKMSSGMKTGRAGLACATITIVLRFEYSGCHFDRNKTGSGGVHENWQTMTRLLLLRLRNEPKFRSKNLILPRQIPRAEEYQPEIPEKAYRLIRLVAASRHCRVFF